MCLQKRELFSFARVLAFPNVSSISSESVTFCVSNCLWHKNSMIRLPFSVFPDPEMPVINTDCCFLKSFKFFSAWFAKIVQNVLKYAINRRKVDQKSTKTNIYR